MKQPTQVSDGLLKILLGVLIGVFGLSFWIGFGALLHWLAR